MTARIEDTLVHCLFDGKAINTLPRRHMEKITRLMPDKKHRSRRAADARHRALDAEVAARAG